MRVIETVTDLVSYTLKYIPRSTLFPDYDGPHTISMTAHPKNAKGIIIQHQYNILTTQQLSVEAMMASYPS